MRIEVMNLKKLFLALSLLCLKVPLWADIAVTQGSGKTVATTSDNSREFQNVVVSTTQVIVEGGVLSPVGYATASSSYMPVAVKNSVAVNNLISSTTIIQPGSEVLATSGTVTQGSPGANDWRVTMATNTLTGPLPAGTNALGSFVSTSTVIQASASTTMNGNATGQAPVMLTSTGTLRMDLSTFGNGTTLTAGQQTMANSIPVTMASNQSTLGTVNVATGGVTAAQGGVWTVQPGNTANLNDWRVTMATNTLTGPLPGGTNALGSFVSTSTVIQASASTTMNGNATGQAPVMMTSTGTLRMDLSTFGNGTTLTAGQQTMANSIPVTMASNQSTIGTVNVATGGVTAAQGGVWTVQPGNTANTTPWIVQVATGGVSVKFDGTQNVQLQTGQNMIGQAAMADLSVAGSTFTVGFQTGQSSVPVVIGNAYDSVNTALRVNVAAGNSITANMINITTAAWDTALPAQGGLIAGISPGGFAQTFRVDIASDVSVNVVQTSFTTAGALGDNGAAATTNRVGVLDGISQTSYRNGTAATQGRDSAASYGTDGLLWTSPLPGMRPASFTASTGSIALAASPTDVAMLCGNASNTVLLYSMRVSCTQTTAGIVPLSIFKRSTADTALFSTMTVTAMDSSMNVGISSAVIFNAANPTVGTAVGQIDNYNLGCMAPGTATPNDIYISPADWRMKPIVLRGVTQCVAVNFNGATMTGSKASFTFNWIETATISP